MIHPLAAGTEAVQRVSQLFHSLSALSYKDSIDLNTELLYSSDITNSAVSDISQHVKYNLPNSREVVRPLKKHLPFSSCSP